MIDILLKFFVGAFILAILSAAVIGITYLLLSTLGPTGMFTILVGFFLLLCCFNIGATILD
jgi:hypothetical protein